MREEEFIKLAQKYDFRRRRGIQAGPFAGNTLTLMLAGALLGPAVSDAQPAIRYSNDDRSTARNSVGVMAAGVLTRADPALLSRPLTEGYVTQPNLLGDAALGRLRFTGTLNLEGYTLRRGELNAGMYGEGYIDRRHPHTLFHEAMVTVAGPSRGGARLVFGAGKGFVPFGTDDPMMRPFIKYPVNHHHAQILERVQFLGALAYGRRDRGIVLEQGWFNGDEPTGPFAAPQWSRVGDSRSSRLTVTPHRAVEWQASTAFVRSPGLTQGGAFDHRQQSTSFRLDRGGSATMSPTAHGAHDAHDAHDGGDGLRYALVELARTDESLGTRRVFRFTSVLAEATAMRRGWALSARAERTERPEGERLLDLFRTANGHVDFQIVGITRWSIGTLQLAAPPQRLRGVPRLGRARLMPFVEVARATAVARRTPAVFVPAEFYGSATQWSLSVGARIHAGAMRRRMGRYVVPAVSRVGSPMPTPP